MYYNLKGLVKKLVNNPLVMHVFHTFWQAAAGVLFAGLVTVHSSADAKRVIAVAVATGLAAVKAMVVARKA